MAGGKSATTIPAPEESRALSMDRENVDHRSDPCAPLTYRTSAPLCRGNDLGRQRRDGG